MHGQTDTSSFTFADTGGHRRHALRGRHPSGRRASTCVPVKSGDETKPLSELMVPTSLRLKVLRLGQEFACAGQLGVKKTFDRIVSNSYSPGAVCMSHTYDMSVRSPMSDIAVINHSDCKNWYAWVTHRINHSYVRSTATT